MTSTYSSIGKAKKRSGFITVIDDDLLRLMNDKYLQIGLFNNKWPSAVQFRLLRRGFSSEVAVRLAIDIY